MYILSLTSFYINIIFNLYIIGSDCQLEEMIKCRNQLRDPQRKVRQSAGGGHVRSQGRHVHTAPRIRSLQPTMANQTLCNNVIITI